MGIGDIIGLIFGAAIVIGVVAFMIALMIIADEDP